MNAMLQWWLRSCSVALKGGEGFSCSIPPHSGAQDVHYSPSFEPQGLKMSYVYCATCSASKLLGSPAEGQCGPADQVLE